MGVLATLLTDPARIQRLRLGIRDRHQIVPCTTWEAFAETCEALPVRVAVVDLFADGQANFERVRRVRQRNPRLALIAYVSPAPERMHDIFDAGRYGFDALVLAGRDDEPRGLLAAVEQAEARALTGLLRDLLGELTPPGRDAILLAVTRAHERLSVSGLTRLLAIPARSLAKRLAEDRLPPPRRLLTWGRLIVAGHMLEDPHRSADRIASSLSFPSGSAFRNTCQRYLHATPGDIRRRGGATYVVKVLLRQRSSALPQPVLPTARSPRRLPAVAI